MRHFDVQLIGGIVLHKGAIAEMKTGEGKTLVSTLPAYLNALEGKGVHIVTVNDYLATRDAEWMGRIHRFLGLNVGTVVNSQSDREKKAAYRCDITYGQNNEYGFDYLRDNMKYSTYDCAQRDLHYAIVDEVDSILIDEARTPLIISGLGETSTHLYGEVTKIVPYLRKDEHYVVDEKAHSVQLTDEGISEAEERLGIKNLYDPNHLEELHVLQQCLRAHALYKRDVNYMVTDDGKVVIIDELTGRMLAGRRWSDGLHQAVEAKEFVKVQEENRTMATITFQNLFRLYKKLSGMTGTAETEAEELHKIYKLDVTQIPTNKGVKRQDFDDLVYKTEREKFGAVVEEIADCNERGQPVLVGTVSVEKSEAIATLLRKRGIKHEVLNAKQHEREAYVVAQAGGKGSVTVATNMAGRGTDIILGGNPEMLAKAEMLLARKDPSAPENADEYAALIERYKTRCEVEKSEVVAAGGLHVVGTERHESRRIDNQLRGRAGRQGDPGSSRFYLSLEDDLMRIFAGERVQSIMDRLGMEEGVPIEHPWVTRSVENAQRKVEARNFDIRKNVLEYDDVMNQQRKSVYGMRRETLEGRYKRDATKREDEEVREVAPKEFSEETVKHITEVCEQMVRHFPVAKALPKTDTDSENEGYRGPVAGAAASTLDEMEALNPEAVEMEAYHYFGAMVSIEKHQNDPKAAAAALTKLVLSSLQQQRERMLDLVDTVNVQDVEKYCAETASRDDWDTHSIATRFKERYGVEFKDYEHLGNREDLAHAMFKQAEQHFEARGKDVPVEYLLRAFRMLVLEEIDRAWIDHLTNMDHLRDGIGLRGYGQKDPKLEFKKEGFDMFTAMMHTVDSNVLTKLFHTEFRAAEDVERFEEREQRMAADRERSMQFNHAGSQGIEDEAAMQAALESLGLDASQVQTVRRRQPGSRRGGGGASLPPPATGDTAGPDAYSPPEASIPPESIQAVRRSGPKVGRNDPCPCGSGKKYKACHGLKPEGGDSPAEGDAGSTPREP
jgi:preprotein translocase subunit SecA